MSRCEVQEVIASLAASAEDEADTAMKEESTPVLCPCKEIHEARGRSASSPCRQAPGVTGGGRLARQTPTDVTGGAKLLWDPPGFRNLVLKSKIAQACTAIF